jgi:hypothetical protein
MGVVDRAWRERARRWDSHGDGAAVIPGRRIPRGWNDSIRRQCLGVFQAGSVVTDDRCDHRDRCFREGRIPVAAAVPAKPDVLVANVMDDRPIGRQRREPWDLALAAENVGGMGTPHASSANIYRRYCHGRQRHDGRGRHGGRPRYDRKRDPDHPGHHERRRDHDRDRGAGAYPGFESGQRDHDLSGPVVVRGIAPAGTGDVQLRRYREVG